MVIENQNNQIKPKPILGGHETFAFRNGWLKKGIDAAINNSDIFTEDNALVTLGVGKNMVRSIKHWCLAAGLLEEISTTSRSHSLRPTWLALQLISDGGWDPYLEREGSLWLLHWQIATNHNRSIVWSLAFSEYLETEFSKLSLTNFVLKQFDKIGIKTTRDMIQRELDCFFHTYVTTRTSARQKLKTNGISEDSLDCPLAELELIRHIPEYDLYHFNIGPKVSLPVEVFGYTLLQFIKSRIGSRSTIALEECIYQPDSPGQIFKLDENSVVEFLTILEQFFKGSIRSIETAGLNQVYLSEEMAKNLDTNARKILQSYYE